MEKIDYKGALLESHIEWPDSSRHFAPVAGDKKSDKKLAKCLKSYEVKDGEEVLFILDDTVFGSATDGILFTERAIYVKKLADSPQRIAYFQIRDASVYAEGKGDDIQMEINGVALGPFGMLDDDFLEPLEAALVHIRIATNQKINEVQQVVESKKTERKQALAEENDQDSKICPSCSASNDEEAKFCSNCACPFPRKKEKKLARCTSCDEMILANSAFCSKCGAKQETQLNCRNCGQTLENGAKFCGSCGAPAGEPQNDVTDGGNIMDWSAVGERAFNLFANTYRKTEDYDGAFEMFAMEVGEAMESSGIEIEWSWSVDLPEDAFKAVYSKAMEVATSSNNEDDIYGPFFTYLEDQKYERESS